MWFIWTAWTLWVGSRKWSNLKLKSRSTLPSLRREAIGNWPVALDSRFRGNDD